MTFTLAVMVVVGFAATLEVLNLPDHARDVGQRSWDCLDVMRSEELSDREKEKVLQGQTKQLVRLLGILGGGSALALGGPLGAVWLLEQMGVGRFFAVLGMLQRLDFLLGTVVVGLLAYVFVVRYWNA